VLSGSGFGGASVSFVSFASITLGGRTATDVVVLSQTEVSCTVPEGAGAGLVDVHLSLHYTVPY